MDIGDVVEIAKYSRLMGLVSWHQARVEWITPKMVKVFWLDCGPRHGTSSYVKRTAIRPMQGKEKTT